MRFVKTTLIGGVLFLVPIIIAVVILGKAFQLMRAVAAPLANSIPTRTLSGAAMASIVSWAAIVVLCFLAGLVARSAVADRLMRSLESGFLTSLPAYGFVKGMTTSLAGRDDSETMVPVLAKFDDVAQLAFEVERDPDGRVVIYVPGAPDPFAGAVMLMSADRIERLDVKFAAALKNIRKLGRGTGELLRATAGSGRS